MASVCFCVSLFQDMSSAVITPCSHFFHAGCLKKWLYVQETCPLCHSQLKSQSPSATVSNQDSPAANQNPAGQEEPNKQDEGANDGKGEGIRGKEGDTEPGMSDGKTPSCSSSSSSSGVTQQPVNTAAASSPSSSFPPSPLVTDSTEDPTPSSSVSSETLDTYSSVLHHSSSPRSVQADETSADPQPAPQTNPGFQPVGSG